LCLAGRVRRGLRRRRRRFGKAGDVHTDHRAGTDGYQLSVADIHERADIDVDAATERHADHRSDGHSHGDRDRDGDTDTDRDGDRHVGAPPPVARR
jgi:hypothetical protein